ncbi:YqeG family HAD IIIA-type phosphatase [Piscirickettsia salmonis]|uniref:YqeG family HAD IIIA-type phosphatase n=1 Tax=Piscirickettsia salmonis TaxID=1238 RepID=UPI0007C8D279|nr:Mitochondrial PGP phosphatase [Piscirickettsiaceae bacterium NZ-RLO1]
MRYFGAVVGMWVHRRWLKKCLVQHHVSCVTQLSAGQLHAKNVKVLALDYDGVLVSHGRTELTAEYQNWLASLIDEFKGEVCILSNKPEMVRELYLQKKFPSVGFIVDVEKKPSPQGLLHIAAHYGVQPEEILLVDDRLLCGMLAVARAKAQGVYIDKPLTEFSSAFLCESFFASLRVWERWSVRLLTLFYGS